MSVVAAISAIAFLATAVESSSTVVVLVPALISAFASVAAAWIGSRNHRNITRTEEKLDTVHVLVNGAAATAMESLAAQTRALVAMTERRDELVAEREAAHLDTRNEPLPVEIVKLPPEATNT